MKFEYYNPKEEKNACVVRSLSKALNRNYEIVKKELLDCAKALNINTYNEVEVFEKYILDNVFMKQEANNKKIKDLNLSNGIYIIFCNKDDFYHMVTVIDNVLYDKSDVAFDMKAIGIYKIDIDNFEKSFMTEKYAREISLWNYIGELEIYNLPSYEEMKLNNYNITKEENYDNYICYTNDNKVIGYVNMKTVDNNIYLGIGIKPEYCGRRFGFLFINDAINEIKKKYPNYKIILEVRSFNKRAIKCYEKSGFKIKDKVIKKDRLNNLCEFVYMEYEEEK